jgi:hypothetical protein
MVFPAVDAEIAREPPGYIGLDHSRMTAPSRKTGPPVVPVHPTHEARWPPVDVVTRRSACATRNVADAVGDLETAAATAHGLGEIVTEDAPGLPAGD